MKSFEEMIDNLGAERLATIFKVDEGHIRVMKHRNSIPQDYWPALMKLGIGIDKLVQLRKAAFRRRPSSV